MSAAFDRFYASVESELTPITYDFEHSPGFNGRSQVDLDGVAHVWLIPELSDPAYSHVAAHEVCHVVQELRGFDKLLIPEASGSREMALQNSLASAVECTAVDSIVTSFGLDASRSVRGRFLGLRTDLRNIRPTPVFSDPFVKRVLAYVRSALEQPKVDWRIIRRGFRNKLPKVAEMAEGFLMELDRLDLQDRDDRHKAFLLLRDGLRLEGRIGIRNAQTGRVV